MHSKVDAFAETGIFKEAVIPILAAVANLIKTDGGFEAHLYNCPANDATIGYGHLVH